MSRIKQLLPEDWGEDDDGPRGPGDPDYYGYPGEPATTTKPKGAQDNGTDSSEEIPF